MEAGMMRTGWALAIAVAASGMTAAQTGRPPVPPARPAAGVAAAVEGEIAVPTKLEALLLARGIVLVKDFYPMGLIGRVSIQGLVVTEPGHEDQRQRGLQIDVPDGTGRLDPATVSFVDLEEINRLQRAVERMSDLAGTWAALEKPYTEVLYVTKGGLAIGFSQRQREQSMFVSTGAIGMTTPIGDMRELVRLREMLQTVQGLLQGK
jgi:hypothetical protein